MICGRQEILIRLDASPHIPYSITQVLFHKTTSTSSPFCLFLQVPGVSIIAIRALGRVGPNRQVEEETWKHQGENETWNSPNGNMKVNAQKLMVEIVENKRLLNGVSEATIFNFACSSRDVPFLGITWFAASLWFHWLTEMFSFVLREPPE